MTEKKIESWLRFEDPSPGYPNIPLCPACGQGNLHQGEVTVYDRGEDANVTIVTRVNDGMVSSHRHNSDKVSNPSERRDGIAIAFCCEHCDSHLEMTIAQHKGMTFMGWRIAEERHKRWFT
jgi:hypothetical protein